MKQMERNKIIKALVVDDQSDIRELMTQILEFYGVESIETADAESALLAYLEENPDIVFSDFVMPGMDVTTFVRALRAIKENLPLVMFTGYMSKMVKRLNDLEIRPDYILKKPFSQEEILHILQESFPQNRFDPVLE